MFNNRLKELRLLHNYTMDDLAKIYNERFNGKLNKSTISRYENGLQEPLLTVVKNFATLFGVSLDYMTDQQSSNKCQADDNTIKYKNIIANLERLNTTGVQKADSYIQGLVDTKLYNNTDAAQIPVTDLKEKRALEIIKKDQQAQENNVYIAAKGGHNIVVPSPAPEQVKRALEIIERDKKK